MSILARIFGARRTETVNPSRIERLASTPSGKDFARPVRAQVYREAIITLESGYSRKGIVLDYTDSGMRIRFPTNESLPRFLNVNARSIGISGRAQVVWQKGPEIGLKLV